MCGMRDGAFILFQDSAGLWCAAPPGFRDLLHDPTGWGKSREEAVRRLLSRADYQARAEVAGWKPGMRDFVIVAAPYESDDLESSEPHPPFPSERDYLHIVR